jgi:hypothetical protein
VCRLLPPPAILHAYVPAGSCSYDALQKNEPATPSHANVFVSINGPPLGAFFPLRKS